MTGNRLAVIDLGSNTFHLLICEINKDETLALIYKERIYVKLASGGLEYIDDVSILGMSALKRLLNITACNVKKQEPLDSCLREAKTAEVADRFVHWNKMKSSMAIGSGYISRTNCFPTLDKQ
jgi:hypothetical protein